MCFCNGTTTEYMPPARIPKHTPYPRPRTAASRKKSYRQIALPVPPMTTTTTTTTLQQERYSYAASRSLYDARGAGAGSGPRRSYDRYYRSSVSSLPVLASSSSTSMSNAAGAAAMSEQQYYAVRDRQRRDSYPRQHVQLMVERRPVTAGAGVGSGGWRREERVVYV
ncbi:uncharacterized protein BKCO1_500087 [Diplodia corticola]|uniref:Uncharacterized protein n=1 Tax=Diplodia corticola TaxID=236234 RepID=A0A1J9SE57_9PEZI|nr:uncharacterized protein BKCO1_500087 [Diplodia corticola]OJD38108.1 hypothetical protein BKCO1_500087 [Diplodia corticola]